MVVGGIAGSINGTANAAAGVGLICADSLQKHETLGGETEECGKCGIVGLGKHAEAAAREEAVEGKYDTSKEDHASAAAF